jgi:2-oxoglutarate/2-oxoacid ferredoxin oxidoreductase subunit beta
MVDIDAYGQSQTAWCPGCGNFGILRAVKRALAGRGLAPHQVLFVSGIGQAAKAPHYLNANVFTGLHGRALPVATGAKLANRELTVIAESGDGCNYSEGGNHLLAAIRRNIDLTLIVHDNQIFALTLGQASPTSDPGHVTKAQPQGVASAALHPLALAVALRAGFVARGFAGEIEPLADLIGAGIAHPGFALIDVLQPCVSMNHVNTFAWYRQRIAPLPPDYDPTDWAAALAKADEWGDRIPVGVIYKNDRPPFGDHFPAYAAGRLAGIPPDPMLMEEVLRAYQ